MNHVFVDFENVPSIDLALLGDATAEVTLLIGEKQRRLELSLVRQIHAHAAKVKLIEVGASGRNALDLVLAWHLGQTVERNPHDPYFVVSKDKDFDPLLTHLRGRGIAVARVEAFSDLPFLAPRPPTRKAPTGRRPASAAIPPAVRRTERAHPAATTPPPSEPTSTANEARLAKLIDRLQHRTKARPTRRKTLLSHVNGFYGNQLTAPELEDIVANLEARGLLAIDPAGRVTYRDEAE